LRLALPIFLAILAAGASAQTETDALREAQQREA